MATTTARPAALEPQDEAHKAPLTVDDRRELLRSMLLMRATEERALSLYRQGKVPGSYYDGRGQEAVSVGSSFALSPRDRACILHRDLGAHLIRGVSPGRVLAQMMGRAGGMTGGRDGNMHFGDRELGCVGMVSMLPDMALVACGLALAFQMRREPRVAMTWFGDGSTANGQWHEAMNVAGVRRLPVVFVLENNQFAYSTPNRGEFAVDPVERAGGYGFPGVKVDGNDVEAVFAVAAEACDRARAGEGPTLIEAETMRMHGHGAHDDMSYVPPELFESWSARDPIERYEQRMKEQGLDVAQLRSQVAEEIDRETDWALAQPMPDPATATERVFATEDPVLGDGRAPWSRWQTGGEAAMPELTYLEAISDGLREEMRYDDSVFCLGEDIGAFGGAFKVTDGFMEEFGADRVWDTPLAESAIVGAAVGAAVEGLRPVCEMQFADFIACGFDQLVNVAAKMNYRQGLAVPMVVRLPSGGGFSGGPFHSQNPEAWFLQAPGLKVVAPSSAEDAKGLLASAIRDPNPVLFLEHKHLYRRVMGEVPEGRYETTLGEALTVREGTDLTVITYGAMVHTALEATGDVEGASIEVVDLRTLCPLDTEAILASVRKTSKVVVLHEATRSCGVGAEVCALIAEEAFEDLDGPVVRVTAPDVPIPFSPPLERAVLPQVDDVKEACRELLSY